MQENVDGKRVFKAGIGYTIGNILVKGIAFLTLPLFSRLMTTEQYGVYNTYAAFVSIIAVIISLGLPSSVRNARYDFVKEENRYNSNSVILILFSFLLFITSTLIFKNGAVYLLGISFSLIVVAVINSACTALQSYYNNILTIDFKYQQFLKLSFFYSISSTVLSIVLIYFVFPNNTALGRAIGNMLPMIAIAVFVLVMIWRKEPPRLKKKYTRYGLSFGLPLIPFDLSSLILNHFDRIMILRFIGETQSGLYSFAYNVALIFQVVTSSVESAWTPWMFEKIHQGQKDELRKKINIYAIILSLCIIMLLLISPELIMLLSKADYWDSKTVIIPILFSMYFFALAAIPVGIEFYYKKTIWISVCTFCTAVCNVVLNWIFIPSLGYQAAAYTTLASYFLYAIFHMLAAGKLLKLNMLRMPAVILSMACVTIMAGIGIFTLEAVVIRWAIEGVIVLAAGLTAFRRRKELRALISTIFNR